MIIWLFIGVSIVVDLLVGWGLIIENPLSLVWGLLILAITLFFYLKNPGKIIPGGFADKTIKGNQIIRYGLITLFWSMCLISATVVGKYSHSGASRVGGSIVPILLALLGCFLIK